MSKMIFFTQKVCDWFVKLIEILKLFACFIAYVCSPRDASETVHATSFLPGRRSLSMTNQRRILQWTNSQFCKRSSVTSFPRPHGRHRGHWEQSWNIMGEGTFCHVLFLAVYSLIPFIDCISDCIWKGIYRLISDCIWKAKNSNEKDKVWLLISEIGIRTCSQTTAHCQCAVQ